MNSVSLREAMFYNRLSDQTVQYQVCFRACIVKQGQRGFCRNKENINGRLYNLVHSRPSAVHVDPIEKEPVLHMLPGLSILCFGTAVLTSVARTARTGIFLRERLRRWNTAMKFHHNRQ